MPRGILHREPPEARVPFMRPRGFIVAALACHLLVGPGPAIGAESAHPRRVLLLYAESRLTPALIQADTALRTTVASGLGAPVDFRTEFLDLPPTSSPAYEQRLRDLLQLKYQDAHLDLIVVLAARPLRVALEYRAELTLGAPIVFMAVDAVGDLALPRDVTGVAMTIDSMDTLLAALRLQPETRRVVVIGGTSGIDKRWLAGTRAALAGAPAHLEFTYLTDLPLDEVAQKLAALRDGTIVILISFIRDSTGRHFTTVEALQRLVQTSNELPRAVGS